MAARALAPALTFLVMLAPLASAADWPMGPRDISGSRTSAEESQITAATAQSMRRVWSFRTDGAVTGTPTIADGLVYTATWRGQVYALDEATGDLVWQHDNGVQVDAPVTVWGGLAFYGDAKGVLHALDAKTGAPKWEVLTDTTLRTHLYSTPVVLEWNGRPMLVMGIASDQVSKRLHGDAPLDFRGKVAAYDPRTGAEIWRTVVIPEGHTGASVWGTPVVDLDAGLAIVGTGNAYTAPAANNTDAIIALSIDTGEIVWSFQATKNDVFTHNNPNGPDDDFGSTGSLYTTPAGERLFTIGQKSQVVRAWHVSNGTLAWRNGRTTMGDGVIGGSAYHDGVVYMPFVVPKRLSAYDAQTGVEIWNASMSDLMFSGPAVAPGVVFGGDASGRLSAFDAKTGALLWNGSTEGAGGVYGGLSIANGRLYVATVQDEYLGDHGGVHAYAPSEAPPPSPTPTPTATPATTPVTLPTIPTLGGGGVVWPMVASEFTPLTLTVAPGTRVTWRNDDAIPHVVASDWDEGATFDHFLDGGESASHVFVAPGEYGITCPLHAAKNDIGVWEGMVARILVVAADVAPEARAPVSAALWLVAFAAASLIAARGAAGRR